MCIRVLAAAVWVIVSAVGAFAADGVRERLPTARLQSRGAIVGAATLARPDPWVLVYVDNDCRVCVDALSGTKADTIDRSRIVVVVAADASPSVPARPSRIEWPPERVYVDSTGAFAAALHLQGVPVIVGLVGDEIHWRWSGALARPELQSLIGSWLESHPAPSVPTP